MPIFNNRGLEKPEIAIFSKVDYQNLINALEIIYHEYWDLLDNIFKHRYEKELFRLVNRLYSILTDKEDFNMSLCLTIRDLDLILSIISEVLKFKTNTDLQVAQELLVDFFKSFYSQFDVIIDDKK